MLISAKKKYFEKIKLFPACREAKNPLWLLQLSWTLKLIYMELLQRLFFVSNQLTKIYEIDGHLSQNW